MTPRRVARLALAGAAAILVSACGLQEGLDQQPAASAGNPSRAPAINADTLAGRPLAWSSLRDHAVVLDFWGSWCGPCRVEQADVNKLYQEYSRRGVVFLGVDMRDDNAAALAYERDLRVAYASVPDSAEQISSAYDVAAPPTVLVVDRRGLIVGRFLGTVVGVSDALNRIP